MTTAPAAVVPHLIHYGESVMICNLPELPSNLSYGAIPISEEPGKFSIMVVITSSSQEISSPTAPAGLPPISVRRSTITLNESIGQFPSTSAASDLNSTHLTHFAVNVAGSSWQNISLAANNEALGNFDHSPVRTQLHSPVSKTSSDVLLAAQYDSNTSRSLLSPGRVTYSRNYSGVTSKPVYFEPNSNQSLNSCYSLGLAETANVLSTDLLLRTSKPITQENKSDLCFLETEEEKSPDCPFCGKKCLKPADLTVHMRCHTGQKPYQCVVCGRAFSQNCNVRKHLKTHKVWPHCAPKPTGENHQSDTAESPDMATNSSNPDPLVFPCPYCESKLESHLGLRAHLKKHKDKKFYQCTVRSCRLLFMELSDLLIHLQSHSLVYKCPTCEAEFSTLNDVGLHQLSHGLDDSSDRSIGGKVLNRLNYRCFHCARRFASLNGLEKHRASESHIHRCPKCSRVLKSGRLLRQHLKKRHIPHKEKPKLTNVPQPKSLSCPECSKRFSRTFLLNRHLATVHRLESQFHCSSEGCGKQFKREDKFRAHMLTHTNFKPHLCSQCGKTFGQARYLKSHTETCHTADKRFNCPTCPKGFSRRILLTKHKCSATLMP